MRLIVLFALALPAAPCLAETCKYVDQEGRTIYSNVPIKNARKVTCFQPPPPVATESAPPSTATPAPATARPPDNKARVDASTQRKRDEERRQILEEELAREESALGEA